MNIAIIPARGGSKRIPYKNIKEFCGKPMIAWSIESCIKANCFDRIIVSTDDQNIAEIAIEHGAEIPFIRPDSLSDDNTGTVPVIKHSIDELEGAGVFPTNVCCVYATAPFVYFQNISKGLNQLKESSSAYAFTVTSFPFPIQRAIMINQKNRIEMFWSENFNKRSQDLEESWHDAGQYYWGTIDAWKGNLPLFTTHSVPIILPRYLVQDIDTLEDWTRAEYMFKAIYENQ